MTNHRSDVAEAFEAAVESRDRGTRIALWVLAASAAYLFCAVVMR